MTEQILKILESDARISMEEIAVMTGQTPAQVADALDQLAQEGVIRGYRTLIDWERAGINRVQALIDLKVSPKKGHGFDEIAETIAAFDEVDSVLLLSGGYDLSVIMSGKSFQDIALFVAKRLSPLDNVLSTGTHFVLRTYKKDGVNFTLDNKDERGFMLL